MKKISIGILITVSLGIAAFTFFTTPNVATPIFTVKNVSNIELAVTALWREKTKDLGTLEPGAESEFEINDEAEMQFRAIKPNGAVLLSEPPIYFTSGTSVKAVITESKIEVSAQ